MNNILVNSNHYALHHNLLNKLLQVFYERRRFLIVLIVLVSLNSSDTNAL